MALNVEEEYTKLIQIINDSTFDLLKFTIKNRMVSSTKKVKLLKTVLMLTIKYPQTETYLKNLLNYFTVDELENANVYSSILHHMAHYARMVSLNSWVIIINHGVNVRVHYEYYPVAHRLLSNNCDNHINNILNLLIDNGIDLTIVTSYGKTVLDVAIESQYNLNEETKNCIMTLIDYGATTNKPIKDNIAYDFVEYYKYSTIKPAIKNENNI